MADSLAKLKAQLAYHESVAAELRLIISGAERHLAGTNGASRPKRSHHAKKPRDQSAPVKESGRPTVRNALLKLVEHHPGIPVRDAIDQLIAQQLTTSPDPRKVLSTRIAQFDDAGVVKKEDGRLYPVG